MPQTELRTFEAYHHGCRVAAGLAMALPGGGSTAAAEVATSPRTGCGAPVDHVPILRRRPAPRAALPAALLETLDA